MGLNNVPIYVPKATKMTKTVQGISSDIAPNGYKGFGGNPRQDWDQEKGGVRLRNPVLYPPELQGQELPKALPTKSLQRSRRMSLHNQSARLSQLYPFVYPFGPAIDPKAAEFHWLSSIRQADHYPSFCAFL